MTAEDAGAVSPRRWFLLAAYALLAASTQLLWLSFAPVDTRVATAMGVDTGAVGDLAAIFPFVYIVLALPAGRWLDAGFGRALATGALLTGGGGLLRLAAPSSFGVAMAGQAVIAAGQPLVLNSITKLAGRYFPRRERAAAISVGSVALFAGILVAVLGGGPLLDAGGLPLLVAVHAAAGALAAVLVVLALLTPPAFRDDPSAAVGLRWLVHDRFMWTLGALIFVGMGSYNVVATWLDAILKDVGEDASAGGLIAVMTFAGVVGAALLPAPVAARGLRRPMVATALGVSAAAFAAMASRHDAVWLGAWLAAVGFLLMACLPVVLEWAQEHAGLERQGAAAGFLMLSGNLGGLVLVLVTQALLGSGVLPFVLLAAAALGGLAAAARLPAHGAAAAAVLVVDGR